MKVKEFIHIVQTDFDYFNEMVNKMIGKGYELYGNTFFSIETDNDASAFHQSMVKYEEEVKTKKDKLCEEKFYGLKESILKIIDDVPDVIRTMDPMIKIRRLLSDVGLKFGSITKGFELSDINDLVWRPNFCDSPSPVPLPKYPDTETGSGKIENGIQSPIFEELSKDKKHFLDLQENRDDNKPMIDTEVFIKYKNITPGGWKYNTDKWNGDKWCYSANFNIKKWAYIPE